MDLEEVLAREGIAKDKSFRYVGREGMWAIISSWGRGAHEAKPVHQSKFIRHHLSTSHIELTDSDTAITRTYWVAYTDIGPDHCGYYVDEFRRVGNRWLIAHRKVREDWMAPDSLYASTVVNLRVRD